MTTFIAIVVAVFFLGMGGYALALPGAVLAMFGLRAEDPRARYEVRAVYGGFGIAMAAILGVAAAQSGSLRTGILLTVAAALAGMAAGRVVAAALDERTGFYPVWFYFVVEAVAAGALFAVA
ncbi:DUF4345 family protein [Nocardia huaxiensis]|uniref:DUF4345 family protein n=1 Tax=Nocardia huaxiensis TaxID=2755382 RepID=A0A7D6VG97_9NOCA|nr:DUF4345 family protein [Nocardia huaxiensis]QLY28950.1 DUF4345 family protein [Nocardia huaxiensis]UFS97572.1 DUF4345 family protein [Nocardia huaxiensis]